MTTVLVKQPMTFQSQFWRSNHRAVPTFSLTSFLSFQEQELAAKAKVGRTRTSSTSSATFNHWRDHDSDQGPPGSCGGGGGGLGGLDTSGARFVFWAQVVLWEQEGRWRQGELCIGRFLPWLRLRVPGRAGCLLPAVTFYDALCDRRNGSGQHTENSATFSALSRSELLFAKVQLRLRLVRFRSQSYDCLMYDQLLWETTGYDVTIKRLNHVM